MAPEEGEHPGLHEFDFQDPQGKRVGGVSIVERNNDKTLHVEYITAGTKEGLPGFLGQRQVIGLLRQLQQEFPNAERIEGLRVSGARPQHGSASVPLRPTPKQAAHTDFILSSMGWDVAEAGPRYMPLVDDTDRATKAQTIADTDGNPHSIIPTHSTTAGDILSRLDVSSITDSPIMKAFGDSIQQLARDIPVHILSAEDMDALWGS